jgi:hypothetical protein
MIIYRTSSVSFARSSSRALQELSLHTLFNSFVYIFLPPVTSMVCPLTYENNGDTTANIELAASVAVPGRPSGMSLYAAPSSPLRSAICLPGMPRATRCPSAVVMKAPDSLARVRRVSMCPKAIVLARTPNYTQQSVFDRGKCSQMRV